MKKVGVLLVIVSIIILALQALTQETSPQKQKPEPQEVVSPEQTPPQEVQKPKLDYMSTFLSRSTAPLGLKEDKETTRLLRQSKAKWAVRAGYRHILN
ncbi:MAG: hypothetical protein H5U07_08535 [Candidatus Aminicenantes bacterium]|nr:hypothetical protein [Candidatus Aminicenantes bacterium]